MEWQLPDIVAILDKDVEGAELYLVIALPGMQRVEICDAIDAEDLLEQPQCQSTTADLVPLGAGTLALCGDFLVILTARSR